MNRISLIENQPVPFSCSERDAAKKWLRTRRRRGNRLDRVFKIGYIRRMKVKTSITLSQELLKVIDQRAGSFKNRSEFIETAIRAFIAQVLRSEKNARDLEIINRRAKHLNEEALDVLSYQVIP